MAQLAFVSVTLSASAFSRVDTHKCAAAGTLQARLVSSSARQRRRRRVQLHAKGSDDESNDEKGGDDSRTTTSRDDRARAHSMNDNNGSEPPDELEKELKQAADEVSGTDLEQWYFYENLRAKRSSLKKRQREKEQQAQEALSELKQSLQELQSISGWPLLDQSNRFTAATYALFSLFLAVPVILAFYLSGNIARLLSGFIDPLSFAP